MVEYYNKARKFINDAKIKKESEEKKLLEAGRLELMNWAKENGSELLKLRIKHDQNWQSIAQEEWAVAHTVGFEPWGGRADSDKDWKVYNATVEQLHELEKAQEENPEYEIDILRCRWNGDDEDEGYTFATFLRCYVKTPIGGYQQLFREISDINEE